MAVVTTFKVRGSNGALGANGTITVTALTTSGPSMIVVHAGVGNNSSSTVASVTINGNSAALAKRQIMPDGFSNTEVWTWWSPAALASVSVVVVFANSAGAGADVQVSESTGTDASSIGNVGGANGTSATSAASVTCSASGSQMIGGTLNFGGTDTAGANTTLIDATSDGAGDFNSMANNNQATTATTSYTVTTAHTSGQWAMAVVEIKPAGAAPATVALPISSVPQFLMVGPGRFRAGPKFRSNSFATGSIGVLAGTLAILFAATATPAGFISGSASISIGNTATLTGSGALAGTSPSTFSASLTPTIATRYPLTKVGRKMFDQQGKAFRFKGRTAWGIAGISASLRATFLDDCILPTHGFNAIECQIPCGLQPSPAAPFDGNGNLPFLKRLDGTTWTGAMPTYASPHTESPDMTTPNPAFWTFVDGIVQDCYQRNIMMLFFPAYLGQGGFGGWVEIMQANIDVLGDSSVSGYGAFIANRYKAFPNITWMTAGDTASGFDPENDLITGLQSVGGQASGPNFSSERFGGSISTDGSGVLGASTTINGAYDWATVITQCQRAYSFASPIMPGYLLEEPYDQEGTDGTGVNATFSTQPVRRYEWWGWLNVIGGYCAGNGFVWRFALTGNGTTTDDYRLHLNTQNTLDLGRLNAFMEYWPNTNDLVPGGLAGMRTLVVSGAGTIDTGNFNCAAQTPDGSLLIAYVSPGGNATIGVDLRSMSGRRLKARWYDPTNDTFTTNGSATGTFSLFNSASSQSFTTPGANSAGDNDWVLVMEAEQAYTVSTLHPFNMVGPGRFRAGPKFRSRSFSVPATVTAGPISGTTTVTFASTSALTGAGALSSATTITGSATGAVTGAGVLAATTTITFNQTGATTGSGVLAGTTTVTVNEIGAITGAGALTGTPTITFNQTGAVTGSGTLAGTSAVVFNQTGAITSGGTGTSAIVFSQTGALTGTGVLTGTSGIAFGQAGTLTIIGTTSIVFNETGTLTGAGVLAGSTAISVAQTGAVTGTGTLTGTTATTFAGSATLLAKGALAGTSPIIVNETGALTGAGILNGSTSITVASTGTLSLIGTSSVVFVASSTLTGAGVLSGSTAIAFGSTTTIKGAGVLAGTTAIVFGGSASPDGSSALIGTATVTFSASSTISGTGTLAGAANSTFAANGTGKGAGALSATSSATFAGSGTMLASGVLAGNSAVTFAGSLVVVAGGVAGSTTLSFSSTAALTANGILAATAAITFNATGSVAGNATLAGTTSTSFVASATIRANGLLTGASNVVTTATGALVGSGALTGAAPITIVGSADATFSDGTRHIIGTTTLNLATSGALIGKGALIGTADITFGGSLVIHGVAHIAGNVNCHLNARATISHFGQAEFAGSLSSVVEVLDDGTSYVSVIT